MCICTYIDMLIHICIVYMCVYAHTCKYTDIINTSRTRGDTTLSLFHPPRSFASLLPLLSLSFYLSFSCYATPSHPKIFRKLTSFLPLQPLHLPPPTSQIFVFNPPPPHICHSHTPYSSTFLFFSEPPCPSPPPFILTIIPFSFSKYLPFSFASPSPFSLFSPSPFPIPFSHPLRLFFPFPFPLYLPP